MRSSATIHVCTRSDAQVPSGGLWCVAVNAAGRRHPQQPLFGAAAIQQAKQAGATLAIDHAGPAAAQWSSERAVGWQEHVDVNSGRRAAALDADQQSALLASYHQAFAACEDAGVPHAVVLDDGGLWHHALSRLGTSNDDDRARATAQVVQLVARSTASVVLCIEDLAPGGNDLMDGIQLASACGPRTLWLSAGSPWLAPLFVRAKGGTHDDSRFHSLASAAMAQAKLAHRCIPIVPLRGAHADAPIPPALHKRAAAHGFDWVCIDARPVTST
jgi:hypothetical protein